jgi:tetratricopeptide (TPR) repeat protein
MKSIPHDRGVFAMRSISVLCVLWIGVCASVDATASDDESLPNEVFVDWTTHNDSGWGSLYRGDLHMAEQHFSKAIERVRPYYKNDPRLLARSYCDLSWVLHRQGRSAEALPLAEWALRARETKNGAFSEPVSHSLTVLGAIEAELGRLDKAEAHLTRVLSILELRDGGDSARVAEALLDLGRVEIARRKLTRAEEHLARIQSIPTSVVAFNAEVRVNALLQRAAAAELRGELPAAVEHLRLTARLQETWMQRDPKALGEIEARIQSLEARIAAEKRPPANSAEAE